MPGKARRRGQRRRRIFPKAFSIEAMIPQAGTNKKEKKIFPRKKKLSSFARCDLQGRLHAVMVFCSGVHEANRDGKRGGSDAKEEKFAKRKERKGEIDRA